MEALQARLTNPFPRLPSHEHVSLRIARRQARARLRYHFLPVVTIWWMCFGASHVASPPFAGHRSLVGKRGLLIHSVPRVAANSSLCDAAITTHGIRSQSRHSASNSGNGGRRACARRRRSLAVSSRSHGGFIRIPAPVTRATSRG